MLKTRLPHHAMRLLLLLLISTAAVHAQDQDGFEGELTSDQQSYDYGDTIVLTYTLTNAGSETVDFFASSSCGSSFLRVGPLRLPQECTTDSVPYIFDPGESNSWIYALVPSELGFPNEDEEQEAIGFMAFDSTGTAALTTFSAPRFLGGPIAVGYNVADRDSVDALRASLGGEITRGSSATSGDTSEGWQLDGTAVADAVAALSDNGVIRFAEAAPTFAGSVYTPTEGGPSPTAITAPAPNPSASSATFVVALERPGAATVDLLDVRGRRVAVLFDGVLASERTFKVATAGLPAGVYVVRVVADGVRQSHRLTVAR